MSNYQWRLQFKFNDLLLNCFEKSICKDCSKQPGCKKLRMMGECVDELLNQNETIKEVSPTKLEGVSSSDIRLKIID